MNASSNPGSRMTPDPLRPTKVGVLSTPSSGNAVSWAAIVAGAVAAAALSMILLVLGTGLGLSSVSPWSGDGVGATAFGIGSILWLSFMQLAASGMGGFITGRLRSRWPDTHHDEVFFRDTAHGFLAWALATLAMATLLASAATSIISGGAKAGAAIAGTAVQAAVGGAAAIGTATRETGSDGPVAYFVDSLFRSNAPAVPNAEGSAAGPVPAEIGRIVTQAIGSGEVPAADRQYLVAQIAGRAGITPAEAEQRIDDGMARMKATLDAAETQARAAADAARKTSASLALWLFVALLLGAFVASLTAVLGGRSRDS